MKIKKNNRIGRNKIKFFKTEKKIPKYFNNTLGIEHF